MSRPSRHPSNSKHMDRSSAYNRNQQASANPPVDYDAYIQQNSTSQIAQVSGRPSQPLPMAPLHHPTQPRNNKPPTAAIRKLSTMTAPISSAELQAVFDQTKQRASDLALIQKQALREELKKNDEGQNGKKSEISARREARVSKEFRIRYRCNLEKELYRVMSENVLAWNILEKQQRLDKQVESLIAELELLEQEQPRKRRH